MDAETVKKILVIDLAFIGDVILATPTMRALKAHFPNASLTMLTIPVTAEIAAMDPYVDEVLVYAGIKVFSVCGARRGGLRRWVSISPFR